MAQNQKEKSVKIVVSFRSSSNESKYYCCGKRRMKIHTEQNKPHRKHMSIAQVITMSLSLIKSDVTIVYIRKNSNPLGMNSNLAIGCDRT